MSKAEITSVADWLGQRGGKSCALPDAFSAWASSESGTSDGGRELAQIFQHILPRACGLLVGPHLLVEIVVHCFVHIAAVDRKPVKPP